MDGKVLELEGVTVDGATSYDASVNLLDGGSTFTINGTDYDILNVDGTQTVAGDVTYRQLMDIINIATTGTPSAGNFHDTAKNASLVGGTYLTYDGKINFEDTLNVTTGASIAIYDSNSDDFTADASISAIFSPRDF